MFCMVILLSNCLTPVSYCFLFIINTNITIPANGNIFCACARIFSARQGRIGRCVLAAVRKVKPDAALRQKDRAGAENVSVRGYKYIPVNSIFSL